MAECRIKDKNKFSLRGEVTKFKLTWRRARIFISDEYDQKITYLGRHKLKKNNQPSLGKWSSVTIDTGHSGIAKITHLDKEYECFFQRETELLLPIDATNKQDALRKIAKEHMITNLCFVIFFSSILITSAITAKIRT